ncbi:MAG: hypothetical protein HYR60_20795 [Acidobacteria bacterium]|nr:hypothetical protein [Acidobacteriota bacterium]
MKRQIQRQIRERYAGVPEEEAVRMQEEEAMSDPVLGPFLLRVRERQQARECFSIPPGETHR